MSLESFHLLVLSLFLTLSLSHAAMTSQLQGGKSRAENTHRLGKATAADHKATTDYMEVVKRTNYEASAAVQQSGSAGLSAATQAQGRACCGWAGSGVGIKRHSNREVEVEEG